MKELIFELFDVALVLLWVYLFGLFLSLLVGNSVTPLFVVFGAITVAASVIHNHLKS